MKALFILFILLASISTYAAFITSDRTVQFRADGSNWISDNVVDNLNSLPNTAPTITLTGSSSVSYTVDATYSELGATCSDTEDDPNPTATISFSPALDMATAATYTATYTCTDSSGSADTVTRTVVVSEANNIPTYAQRTHLVTSGAVGGGNGSDVSPWTLTEAMANAVAGNIIGIESGIYTGSDPGGTAERTPAFMPENSGVDGSYIEFVAENPANANTSNLSDIRSGATVQAAGWPAFGSNNDYVKWVGVYSSNADTNNKTAADSAPAVFWSANNNACIACKLVGHGGQANNYSGLRVEYSDDFVGSNSDISGFTGSTNASGIIVYKSARPNFHNNEIYNSVNGIQIKGSEVNGVRPIYGMRAYNNLVHDVTTVFRLHGPVKGPSNELNLIYQNVAYNADYVFDFTSSNTHIGEQDGLRAFNNSFYNIASGLYLINHNYQESGVTPRDNEFFNNIVSLSGAAMNATYATASDIAYHQNYATWDRNVYHNVSQFGDGTSLSALDSLTLSDWQSTYSQDVNSITSDPLLIDPVNLDFKLQGGSPALILGRDTLGQFGTTNAVIPAGAYVTGSEVIGVASTVEVAALTVGTGAQLYVTKTGSDSTTTCLENAPCLTIQYALNNVSAGDTINIGAGTYQETSDVQDGESPNLAYFSLAARANGTLSEPITLRAKSGDEGLVIIDGQNVRGGVHTSGFDYHNIYNLKIINARYGSIKSWTKSSIPVPADSDLAIGWRIERNDFDHATGPYGTNISHVAMWGTKNWVVRNNLINDVSTDTGSGNVAGIQAYGTINALVTHNRITNAALGIYWKDHFVQDGSYTPHLGSEISYNLIEGVVDGLLVHGTAEQSGAQNFHHNIIRGYTRAGIRAETKYGSSPVDPTDFIIAHNIFDSISSSNDSSAIWADEFKDIKINGNIFVRNRAALTMWRWTDLAERPEITAANYNVYGTLTARLAELDYHYGGVQYANLAAWQAALASESESLTFNNPDTNGITSTEATLFNDIATGDYTHKTGSPALGMMSDGSNAGPYQLGTETIGVQP